jgi:DNA processing protein
MSSPGRDGCLLLGASAIDAAGLRELLTIWDPRTSPLPHPKNLPPKAASLAAEAAKAGDPAALADRLVASGIAVTTLADDDYPPPLRELPDPPPALYYRGAFLPWKGPAIALVGSRKASPYGLRMARSLAAELASGGWTVVSGLAWGADAAAHRGALEAGGRTVGVLGSGIDSLYPAEHATLAEAMTGTGAVVTEFPLGTPPLPRHFPRRNRIIAGLCLGVVVVEAGERSGTLITARLAAEQGKEVFAVPHQVGSPGGKGCLLLLKQGAALVEKGEDIAGCWPYLCVSPAPGEGSAATPPADRLLALLSSGPATAEEIAASSGLPLTDALGILSRMEIEGSAVRGPGGRYHAG